MSISFAAVAADLALPAAPRRPDGRSHALCDIFRMDPARHKAEPSDGGAHLHLALDVDDARAFLDDGYLRLDKTNASFSGLAVWVGGEARPVEVLELDVRPHVP